MSDQHPFQVLQLLPGPDKDGSVVRLSNKAMHQSNEDEFRREEFYSF
jgi:hypothetical protein